MSSMTAAGADGLSARSARSARSALAALSAIVPGTFCIERGTSADYAKLAHLHYAPGKPATWAGVWRVRYCDFGLRILDFGLQEELGRAFLDSESAMQN